MSSKKAVSVIPHRIRWLAISAGCVSGLAGLITVGLPPVFVPLPLILGAIVQPSAPRLGRWLLLVGAMLLSVSVGILFVPSAVERMAILSDNHDAGVVGVNFLFVLSIALVMWTDVELVINDRRRRSNEA